MGIFNNIGLKNMTGRVESNSRGQTFALAMLVESGLGFLGLLVAWLGSIPLIPRLVFEREALTRGIVATVPMIALLLLLTFANWRPLVEFRRQVEAFVKEIFPSSSPWELALVSLAAGFGEELLFRGALQPLVSHWTSPAIGLIAVSLLFGAMHAVSKAYFILAALVGLYLGWLAMSFDDLVAPITAHALYDFVALMVMQHRVRRADPS